MFCVPGRVTLGAFLAAIAVLVLPAHVGAAAINWSEPVHLGYGAGILDADFSGAGVAVVWAERWAHPPAVGLRSSADGGLSFSRRTTFAGASDAAVAVCGAEVDVAYPLQLSAQRRQIVSARGTTGRAKGFTHQVVVSRRSVLSMPDVACADGRVFVSWYEGTVGHYELYIASALRSDGVFGTPIHLASDHRDYPHGLAIAASGNHAYAVYGLPHSPDLYVKSWTIGPAPDYKLSGHPLRRVTHQPKGWPAFHPSIDADGSHVAVAWSGCVHENARVSSDAGLSWGGNYGGSWCPKPNDNIDGASGANAIDINGDAVVLTVDWGTLGINGEYVVVTHDAFASSSAKDLWASGRWGATSLVGWVKIGHRTVLADMFATRTDVRYKHRI